MWVMWVAIAVAILAMTSGGLALALRLIRPAMPRNRRALWAAGLAALLPSALAIGGFLSEGLPTNADDWNEWMLGLAALVMMATMLFAVICLPAAWVTSARLERGGRSDPALPDGQGEDAPLIA